MGNLPSSQRRRFAGGLPVLLFLLAVAIAPGGCRQPEDAPTAAAPGGARPAEAVRVLAERLRANDPAGFATAALPPALHARVAEAWRAGHSRWPLDELPLDARLPGLLATLSRPDAQATLQRDFDRQFAGASGELRTAATTLGQFAVEYFGKEASYTDAERAHYVQAVQALSRWAAAAPLSDRQRARRAIATLAAAARRTGIDGPDDFARRGMDGTLARLGPFLAALKQALRPYGLDLDATLDSVEASLVAQTGDTATVRLRYRLGESGIDAVVPVRRVEGRWYLADYLARAEASLHPPAPVVPGGRADPP